MAKTRPKNRKNAPSGKPQRAQNASVTPASHPNTAVHGIASQGGNLRPRPSPAGVARAGVPLSSPPKGAAAGRRRKRKRNLTLYYWLIFILVLIVGIALSLTVLFPIKEIRIEGECSYTPEQIINVSGLKLGDNLIRANFGKAEEALSTQLVYLEDVDITRSFPDAAVIHVTPSIPFANVSYEGGILLVSQKGKILESLSSAREGLITLIGTTPADPKPGVMLSSEDEAKDKTVRSLFEYIEDLGIDNVSQIDVTDRYNISLLCDNRILVELGSTADMEYKLRYSQKLIKDNIPSKKQGTLTMLGGNSSSFRTAEEIQRYEQKFMMGASQPTSPQESEAGLGSGTVQPVTTVPPAGQTVTTGITAPEPGVPAAPAALSVPEETISAGTQTTAPVYQTEPPVSVSKGFVLDSPMSTTASSSSGTG